MRVHSKCTDNEHILCLIAVAYILQGNCLPIHKWKSSFDFVLISLFYLFSSNIVDYSDFGTVFYLVDRQWTISASVRLIVTYVVNITKL